MKKALVGACFLASSVYLSRKTIFYRRFHFNRKRRKGRSRREQKSEKCFLWCEEASFCGSCLMWSIHILSTSLFAFFSESIISLWGGKTDLKQTSICTVIDFLPCIHISDSTLYIFAQSLLVCCWVFVSASCCFCSITGE